jgi:hypothetical protein
VPDAPSPSVDTEAIRNDRYDISYRLRHSYVSAKHPEVTMSWQASADAKQITHYKDGSALTATDKCVLMLLADYANPESGYAFPSIPTLAKYAGLKLRGTQMALDPETPCRPGNQPSEPVHHPSCTPMHHSCTRMHHSCIRMHHPPASQCTTPPAPRCTQTTRRTTTTTASRSVEEDDDFFFSFQGLRISARSLPYPCRGRLP